MLTRERFQQGLNYEAYKAQMTCYRHRFEAEERRLAHTTMNFESFRDLPVTVNVLVLTEDRCDVAVDSLPLLARLAAEVGRLNVRIFVCSQHLDLVNGYLKRNEGLMLPIIAFFSSTFQALGHWNERPSVKPLNPPASISRQFLTAADWRELIWETCGGQGNGVPPGRGRMHQWFQEIHAEQQQVIAQDLLWEWRQLIREGFCH